MSEENRKEELSDKKEPLHKNFFIRVIFVGLIVIVLYFVVSPYQNCIKELNHRVCINNTNW